MKKNDYVDELREMAGFDEDGEVVETDEPITEHQKEIDIEGSKEYSIFIKVKDMRHFMMRHTYTSFSGWFGIVISLIALLMLIIGRDKYGTFEMIALGVLALLFTVVQPLQLMGKAKRQIRSQESFKEPLVYNICDEGIVIRQNDQRADIVWSEVRKVIETKKAVFIYTSPVRAFIFPKDQVDDFSSFRKMIREKTGK